MTRAYRQQARAVGTEDTRRRILEAAIELFTAQPFEEVSLHEVGARAGTTAHTVLRHFQSKDSLFAAGLKLAGERVEAQRNQAPVGDVRGALANLAEHYEEWGDRVLRMLAREEAHARIVAEGRRVHERWVKRTFAPQLKARPERLDGLIALTDVYVWKILRRDRKLSRARYIATLEALIDG